MGFKARNFSFDRVPCSEFGLRIYDIDGNSNDAAPFASTGDLITDVIPSTGRNFLFGRSYEDPLEFTLVFGLDPLGRSMDEHLDRYEMDAIANWLTGPTDYRWLEIEQGDMEILRYRCIISELEPIQLSWLPWAFTARITCDSPYGYMWPQKMSATCSGLTEVKVNNRSTLSRLYYPKTDITLNGSKSVAIRNESTGKEFRLDNLPTDYFLTISVDHELGIVTCNDPSYPNMYKYCNFEWLGLKKGMNKLTVTGNCLLDIRCEFPVNFGG